MLEGVDVLLNTNYYDFIIENKDIANKTVFTGPIDEFYNYRFGELEYRSLKFDTKILQEDNFQGNAAVNYTAIDVPYTRIIEHKHFEFGLQPKTVITYEFPADWKRGDEPYCPINDENNGKIYHRYRELADKESNVIFGGRLGQYKYYDMDKIIKIALKLLKKNSIDNKLSQNINKD